MGGNKWFHLHKNLMSGQLTLEEKGITRWRGGGMVCFAPVPPAKGIETQQQTELAKEILGKYGFDYSVGCAIGGRELHHLIFIQNDKEDPAKEKKADDCIRVMITRFGARGWAASAAPATMQHAAGGAARRFRSAAWPPSRSPAGEAARQAQG